MKIVNIHEAKTHFSKLVSLVLAGERVIIAKAGVPVVEMHTYAESNTSRRSGQLRGVLNIPDDFDAPLPESVMKDFYGNES